MHKATGSYCTYSIPGKTAALVPEFTVEDLPSAELQPRFLRLQCRICPWAEHTDMFLRSVKELIGTREGGQGGSSFK